MIKSILHKANTRGEANHGWLQSKHTFSFAHYHHPERMHFGALRVLNDDFVAPGMGFGTHPHNNMEIISIPLEGDLEHRDSMGNISIIKNGDIQILSAGTGITHSEYNKSKTEPVKFLQIWVFPNQKDVSPRYDQISLNKAERQNKFQQILSPNPADSGVWIHQQAWFHLADLSSGSEHTYPLKDNRNGLYVFVLKGNIQVGENILEDRDGLGLLECDEVSFKPISDTELLLMEVPIHW
jgi:quercetin 2,3-dioxygenase